jgi:hypothetical protein
LKRWARRRYVRLEEGKEMVEKAERALFINIDSDLEQIRNNLLGSNKKAAPPAC